MDSADHCPTEDAVCILLEYLVDPALPSKSSARIMPSQSDQELVAKQVHAVVLLYNYYYRKQHPHLKFLGFEDFCKLAIIGKPTLLAYMKLMQLSDDTELEDLEKQLSLTEKKIMDACDIAASLDASQNAPSPEGWPICNISVFLIDSRKENCLLNLGSTTQGVWSMIEKEVDLSNNNSKGTMDADHVIGKRRYVRKALRNKSGADEAGLKRLAFSAVEATTDNPIGKRRYVRKPLRNESGADEAGLKRLAFSAVEETTGINQSDLLVLEKQVTYSISKEKAASCFYIMQCTQPNRDHLFQNPIKDVIDSLQGPLFVRSSDQWTHTSVVEYFHLLPYAEILSNWASKKGPSNSLQVKRGGSETVNVNNLKRIEKSCEKEVSTRSCRQHLGSSKETTKHNENDECYVIDSPGKLDGLRDMEVDHSPMIHSKNKKDAGSKVLTSKHLKQTSGDGCSNGSVDEIQRIAENGSIASRNKVCNDILLDKDRMLVCNSALVQYHPNSNRLDKLIAIIASKNQELSQVALKVNLSKRAKLCLQQRDIEDQIVQCDRNIQTILNGGEGDLALKIESLIEACNDVPLNRSKESPANAANMHDPTQELDDLCCRNNWILPTYTLFPRDGGFCASIILKGMDFEYSSSGELCPHPREARASAATKMLAQLRNAPNINYS